MNQRVSHLPEKRRAPKLLGIGRNTRKAPPAEPSVPQPLDPRPVVPLAPLSVRTKRLLPVLAIPLLLAPMVAALCYLVSLRTTELSLGYALGEHLKEQHKLIQESRELRVELASLLSPAELARQAAETLKMKIPSPQEVLSLDNNGQQIPPLPPPLPDLPELPVGRLVE
jgi:cell division protein FtsL